MSDLIKELEAVRQRAKDTWHGIGEPVVLLNPERLLVSSEDPMQIHMRISDFIALVDDTLKS